MLRNVLFRTNLVFVFVFFFSYLSRSQENNIVVDENSLIANSNKTKPKPVKSQVKRPIKPQLKPQVKMPPPAVLKSSAPPSKTQPLTTNNPPPLKIAPKTTPPGSTSGDISPPIQTKKSPAEELQLDDVTTKSPIETTLTTSSESVEKYSTKNRKALSVDYNTWYEILKIKDKNTSLSGDSKAHYFGVGLNYDYTVYEENYGYAVGFGVITGNAQAGTMNSGEYYERRIRWLGYRASGRLLFRVSDKFEIGPALIAQFKNTNWPEQTDFTVLPQLNPQYFFFFDTRWRISYPLELIQSFGFHSRQYALIWRLGISYTLN